MSLWDLYEGELVESPMDRIHELETLATHQSGIIRTLEDGILRLQKLVAVASDLLARTATCPACASGDVRWDYWPEERAIRPFFACRECGATFGMERHEYEEEGDSDA